MEIENIVANTVLLKAREGERRGGGEGGMCAPSRGSEGTGCWGRRGARGEDLG